MNIPVMRAQLLDYITDASEKKITGLFYLLEELIDAKATDGLTTEEMNILNLEREKYLMSDGVSYKYGEIKELINKRNRP